MSVSCIFRIMLLLALSLSMFVQGCATFRPQTASCQNNTNWEYISDTWYSGYPAHEFSFLPPPAVNWCVYAAGPWGAVFNTAAIIGKYIDTPPTDEDYWPQFDLSWLALWTSRSRNDDARITDALELKEFVEPWLRAGGWAFEEYGDVYYMVMPVTPEVYPGSGMTLLGEVETHVKIDDSIDADCVRYDLRYKSRGAVDRVTSPDGLWTSSAEGIFCRHPDSEWLLIRGQFLEIRVAGREDPELSKKLRKQVEPVFQSLKFKPL